MGSRVVGCARLGGVSLALGLLLAGCPREPHERMRSRDLGPSEASCPEGSTLTYDTFGRAFFESYCTRCHASTLVGGTARNGAPDGYDFDSIAGVLAHADEIDAAAAAGPERINEFMPLSAPRPSDAERDMLGEWLACGAPE